MVSIGSIDARSLYFDGGLSEVGGKMDVRTAVQRVRSGRGGASRGSGFFPDSIFLLFVPVYVHTYERTGGSW